MELLWLTAGGTMASCGSYDGLLWRSTVWELLSLILGVNLLIREAAITFSRELVWLTLANIF